MGHLRSLHSVTENTSFSPPGARSFAVPVVRKVEVRERVYWGQQPLVQLPQPVVGQVEALKVPQAQ